MTPARALMDRILRSGLVDTHYHVGPEGIPRRYDTVTLSRCVAPTGATVALKNHATPTTALAALARRHLGARFVGGIVLNWFVGGLSPAAVHAAHEAHRDDPTHAAAGSTIPMVVWMPTVHAASHIRHFGFTYDPRWSGCCTHPPEAGPPAEAPDGVFAIPSAPVHAFEPGTTRPTEALLATLQAVARCGATLATGHLEASEVVRLVPLALELGVSRVIVTHPHYPANEISDSQLVELVAHPGVFVEHCFAIHTIEAVPLSRFVRSILATGWRQVVLSTDFGQVRSEPFPAGTERYLEALLAAFEGRIPDEAFVEMFSGNGARALGIVQASD